MGGYGSGPGGSKPTTGELNRLDIRWLNQQGYLTPNRAITLSWHNTVMGEKRPAGNIGAYVYPDRLDLVYSVTEQNGTRREYNYPVYLDHTPCNYGGQRAWFICPSCSQRAAVLYLRRERFLCRTCQGLTYSSCKEAGKPLDQALTRLTRIKRKLGDDSPGILGGIPPRPKGMHHKTYWRYVSQWYRLENALTGATLRALGINNV